MTPASAREREILLTGATGFLGMELLHRLLTRTDRTVLAPVRAADDAAAEGRLDTVLATLLGPDAGALRHRVRAVAADLEQPGLGRSEAQRRALVAGVDTVVHCAASVAFTLPLPDARRSNVDGTRTVLELAALAPDLDRVVHVSTAYVAGDRPGVAHEHEGDVGQTSRNTYERTKLEAEAVVAASGLPHCVLRPSIVVGDAHTGWTPAFNVIYWPLQALSRGLLPVIPGDPGGRADVVTVDVVADALLRLACQERRTGTFHAAAGELAPTAQDLVDLAVGHFGIEPPRFVAIGEAPDIERYAGAFLPYFRVRGSFDLSRGRTIGVAPRPVPEVFDTLMRHAVRARWGRTPVARWEAQELRAAA
ncbi:NAD-dependent epimerase/dehydratase family protein [Conexibacter sp. W3-3-2]|uniref:SDR family oxidoreductase n=1 Tax=Conexibacter sp. W3-3-2 TaxID=2675227 RepID=UPI0012BA35EE|nr:SDR family oxidoreductase [Conexibacter sp. W3-3-2]MTD43269.1 NAD-dependent epimerase/dehydratase family protein [Conexibacter sp. W3-3-2]